jgi:hypothetical protein
MGGLILANAIKNGLCDIERSTSTWYTIGVPWRGSKLANVLANICADRTSLLTVYLRKQGYCTDDYAPAAGFAHLRAGEVSSELGDIALARKSGSMCGISSTGIPGTVDSMYLPWLASLALFDYINDSAVESHSCIQHNEKFIKGEAENRYFADEFNHLDATCRNGDGFVSTAHPCSYFYYRN